MCYIDTYRSSICNLTITADEDSLLRLDFARADAEKTNGRKNDVIIFVRKWLDSYFGGEKPSIEELKLNPLGNEFRKTVWQILCEIPYGQVTTYGNIAKETAKRRGVERLSAQAIGRAVGCNPIAIIIPCHRVIGANGHLTGYAGGLSLKQKLLEHEGIEICDMYIKKVLGRK